MKDDFYKVVDFNIFLSRGYSIGEISIPIDYMAFALGKGHVIDAAKSKSSCVSKQREDETTLETYEELVECDISNVGRCMLFLCAKYPHASFVPMLDSIRIDSLTLDEMIDCLSQECLRLRYSIVDKEGLEIHNSFV